MSKKTELNSRHYLFTVKVSACFFSLLLGFLILAPQASMQDETRSVASNTAVIVNSARIGNYRPTPEPPKSTVRGRVFYEDTGRVVKRASIMLLTKDSGRRELSGLTDGSGNFQIKDVPAGTYYAFVNAPGVVSPLAYADISKPRMEGFGDAAEGFQPIITNGVSDIDVQISARRGGAISGRVMYSDGDAAVGVKVEILRKVKDRFLPVIPNFSSVLALMGGGGGSFQTDDRGVYRFSGLPAGEYIVKVTENASHSETKVRSYSPFDDSMFGGGYSLLTMYYPDVFKTDKAQIINVTLGQEQPEIIVTIPDRDLYGIGGKVVAAKDKSPIKNAKIYLKKDVDNTFSIFDELSKRQQSGVTDEQGNWSFKEIPKGNYKLVVEPPDMPHYEDDGYMTNSNSGYMGNRAVSNSQNKPKFAKKIQEITIEDKSLLEIVVELGYGATVSGTVATENSQVMPSTVSITASKGDDQITSSTTIYNSFEKENQKPQKLDHDFKLEGVAEGKTDFRVSLNDDDFYVKSIMLNGTDLIANQLELKEGENLRNVQVLLAKGVGTIKGKVLDGEKSPAKKAEFLLVPIDAAKRKNPSFFRNATTNENGEFEMKAAPGEYAVVFLGESVYPKNSDERDKWLDEVVKNAVKVTVKTNETEKISLTAPK